jgi:hypothetical protein
VRSFAISNFRDVVLKTSYILITTDYHPTWCLIAYEFCLINIYKILQSQGSPEKGEGSSTEEVTNLDYVIGSKSTLDDPLPPPSFRTISGPTFLSYPPQKIR